jgi:hypothetical protein
MMLRRNGVRVVLGWAVAAAAFAAVGTGCKTLTCQSPGVVCDQDYSTFCVGDSDCRQGLVCSTSSRCTLGCTSNTDCQHNGQTDQGQLRQCQNGFCELAGAYANCMDDTDCMGGESCVTGGEGCAPNGDGGPDGAVTPDGTSHSCTVDGDCAPGEQCNQGACSGAPCTADNECAYICETTCQAGSCATDGDCQPDDKCVNGRCARLTCSANSECNDQCHGGHCVECASDADCANPTYPGYNKCRSGFCVPETCTMDSDCPQGLICSPTDRLCYQCLDDSNCTGGKGCGSFYQCGTHCTQDSDCAGGGTCDSSHICS